MDQEHWQKVQRLFESALEQPTDEIPRWLERACGGDASLKAEVESLLHSDAEAGSLGKTVAGDVTTPMATRGPNEPMATREQGALASAPLKFGKYQIEQKIGQGGFGVVYRGRDTLLGRNVALKTCSTEDGPLRRRFFREGRIAAGLQHPNVTTVHDLGVEEGVPYLVQEFLHGEDLDHLIDRREPLPLATKLDYLVQIARGLEYAHGAGVLHRDIKPANVRLHESGGIQRIKIMDFGIARLLTDDTRLTGTGMAMGTVGYLAPEQLRGEDVDTRADVFSYGVLAYELLSYQRPFKGENFSQISYQLLYVEAPPLTDVWPTCPAPLSAIVGRCLEKQQARRYLTLTEVLGDLEPLLGAERATSSGAVAEPTLVLPVSSNELPTDAAPVITVAAGRARQGLAATVLALVLGLAALLAWLTLGPPSEPGGQGLAEVAVSSRAPEPGAAEPAGKASSAPMAPGEPPVGRLEPGPTSLVPAARTRDTLSANPQPPRLSAAPSSVEASSPSSAAPSSAAPSPVAASSSVAPPSTKSSVAADAGPAEIDPVPPSPQPARLGRPPSAGATSESATGLGDAGTAEGADPPPGDTPKVEAKPPPPVAPIMKRGDLLKPGPGVVAPRLLERPQPVYPERARRRRKQARVVVRVLVDENGRVLQAVAPPAGRFGFGLAAKRAALGARFEPATRDGIAGKMWTELPFEFKLR